MGRGVTGANVVPVGAKVGAKAAEPSANLVPELLAPLGTCLAPGAKVSIELVPTGANAESPEAGLCRKPPTLAAIRYATSPVSKPIASDFAVDIGGTPPIRIRILP